MMRYVAASAILMLAGTVNGVEYDCAGSACPRVEIKGDREATLPDGTPSPFRGFADPTVRRDPDTGRLWMAYSWPSIQVKEPASKRRFFKRKGTRSPHVDIHLAASDDGGRSWQLIGDLWGSAPARSPDGKPGHMSYEVANLLPVKTAKGVIWYGARLEYFLPDKGGFRKRPPESFRILVSRADHPGGLSKSSVAQLGSMATDPAWGVDVNLAALSPETRHCLLWNEPALYHDGKELFLVLSGMAFHGKTPVMEKNELVVYATRAEGEPSQWTWRYAGKLATAREARELGGERLTQIDLAMGRDGTLLAILTPDTWDKRTGDFVHHGCRVVEVEAKGGSLHLARDARGKLKVRAVVTASDAGAAGTGASTYEPASETGIILTKRHKTSRGISKASELAASLHRTGVHP